MTETGLGRPHQRARAVSLSRRRRLDAGLSPTANKPQHSFVSGTLQVNFGSGLHSPNLILPVDDNDMRCDDISLCVNT